MRAQHLLNALLAPSLRGQPANELRRVLPAGLGCKEFVFRFLSLMFLYAQKV